MINLLYDYWVVWFIILELGMLLGLYKYYISHLNAQVWEKKASEEGWLTRLLEPAILEVSTLVSTTVLEEIEHKYRQSMGVLTRVSGSGAENPQEMGLSVAENILKDMGWKSPSILMVARLAGSMMGLGQELIESPEDNVFDDPTLNEFNEMMK
jgi:hypothetical protein